MRLIFLCKGHRTAAVVLAIAATVVLAARAEAQVAPGPPDQPVFGLFGIARGQSALLNVSIGNPGLRPGQLPPDPCHVTLGFVNDSNQPLTNRRGGMITADGIVRPGASLSLEIHSAEVFNAGDGGRKLMRPVVIGEVVPGNPDLPAACPGLAATLEVLDSAAGATSVLYAPTAGFTAPGNPDQPAFGLVGVVRGQGAELHVVFIGNPNLQPGGAAADAIVITDTAACQVNLALVDDMGTPVFDRRGRMVAATGMLLPGESLTLNLASGDVFQRGEGRRRGIRAIVIGESVPGNPDFPPGPCRGLVPTLEIVDGQGQTSILYAPTAGWTVPGTPDQPAGR